LIKGSKDSDIVSNENFSKTLWPSGWALGQATWATMAQKLPYLFKDNAQNCIAKTPTQSSVRVINKVLDFHAFMP